VHLPREVLEQERHPVLDAACLDQVIVIEHQPDVVRQRAELVEHGGEDSVCRCLTRLEEREDAGADL
jgi:hypothetical protein